MNGKRWLAVLAAIFTCLGTVLGVLVDDGGGGETPPAQTVEAAPTPQEVKEIVAEAPPAGELQADPDVLRDETPPNVPVEKLEEGEREAEKIVSELDVSPANSPNPVAGAQGYSCRKSFQTAGVGAYRSYWLQFVWHFTVSANRPGWDDVYAIKNYLQSVGLSATFIIDAEGHCLQTAPLDRNPQTQGPFNTSSVSVEIIATGKETRAEWLAMPLIKDGILAALTRDHLLGAGLPLKFVDPVGCTPKAGVTDHDALECGNNHWDVGEQFPFEVVLRDMRAGPDPCGKQCRKYRPRHRLVHRQLEKRCATKKDRTKTRPKECRRLHGRNRYMHRLARKRGFNLVRPG